MSNTIDSSESFVSFVIDSTEHVTTKAAKPFKHGSGVAYEVALTKTEEYQSRGQQVILSAAPGGSSAEFTVRNFSILMNLGLLHQSGDTFGVVDCRVPLFAARKVQLTGKLPLWLTFCSWKLNTRQLPSSPASAFSIGSKALWLRENSNCKVSFPTSYHNRLPQPSS